MNPIEKFEVFYRGLTTAERKGLITHILRSHAGEVSEGVYAGPPGTTTRGLFAGPSASSQGRCPTCGRQSA